MIHEVIKFPSGIVIVFDEKGEQIPEYQGSSGSALSKARRKEVKSYG